MTQTKELTPNQQEIYDSLIQNHHIEHEMAMKMVEIYHKGFQGVGSVKKRGYLDSLSCFGQWFHGNYDGGSFAHSIFQSFKLADLSNRRTLLESFPQFFKEEDLRMSYETHEPDKWDSSLFQMVELYIEGNNLAVHDFYLMRMMLSIDDHYDDLADMHNLRIAANDLDRILQGMMIQHYGVDKDPEGSQI
jgi:hypothetical protein